MNDSFSLREALSVIGVAAIAALPVAAQASSPAERIYWLETTRGAAGRRIDALTLRASTGSCPIWAVRWTRLGSQCALARWSAAMLIVNNAISGRQAVRLGIGKRMLELKLAPGSLNSITIPPALPTWSVMVFWDSPTM